MTAARVHRLVLAVRRIGLRTLLLAGLTFAGWLLLGALSSTASTASAQIPTDPAGEIVAETVGQVRDDVRSTVEQVAPPVQDVTKPIEDSTGELPSIVEPERPPIAVSPAPPPAPAPAPVAQTTATPRPEKSTAKSPAAPTARPQPVAAPTPPAPAVSTAQPGEAASPLETAPTPETVADPAITRAGLATSSGSSAASSTPTFSATGDLVSDAFSHRLATALAYTRSSLAALQCAAKEPPVTPD